MGSISIDDSTLGRLLQYLLLCYSRVPCLAYLLPLGSIPHTTTYKCHHHAPSCIKHPSKICDQIWFSLFNFFYSLAIHVRLLIPICFCGNVARMRMAGYWWVFFATGFLRSMQIEIFSNRLVVNVMAN